MASKKCIASLVLVLNAVFFTVLMGANMNPSVSAELGMVVSVIAVFVFLMMALLASLFIIDEKGNKTHQILGMILIIIIPLLLVYFVPSSLGPNVVVSMIPFSIVNIIITIIGIYLLRK
ncbi:MAG: hypothetical protein ABIH52_02265 [Candidatus Aenigmatarchaeota archaeon]|nr:hypothetical protein [Nanoarchaeota archaeon]